MFSSLYLLAGLEFSINFLHSSDAVIGLALLPFMSTRTLTSQTQHTLSKWYVYWFRLNVGFANLFYSWFTWILLAFHLLFFFLFHSMDVLYCADELSQPTNHLPDTSGVVDIPSQEVALADPYLVDTSKSSGLEYHLEVTGNVNDVITTAGHVIKTGLDLATHTPSVLQGIIGGFYAGNATGGLLTTAGGLTPGVGVLATSVVAGITVGTLIANADIVVNEISHLTEKSIDETSPATASNPFLHDFSTNLVDPLVDTTNSSNLTNTASDISLSAVNEAMSISTFFG